VGRDPYHHRVLPEPIRPLDVVTVAHRAGNDLTRLAAARRAGVDLVEADVHLFRDRLEVRHAKTLGPVPVLWDRWEVHPPWTPRLTFDELLEAWDGEILVDLKSFDARLAPRVVETLRRHGRDEVVVCGRRWSQLDALRGAARVRTIHSVGHRFELRALLARYGPGRLDGICLHQRLLDEHTMPLVRRRSATILSWPVDTWADAVRLEALGVTGIISDDLELLERVRRRRPEVPAERSA
jgi:glycerophosphoryl diester phosphodiesterase